MHFFCYTWGFVFVQFNYWQFDLIYFLIHWLIQILTAIVLLILHTKCIQKFVKMWDTFWIHLVYILYTSIVYILYNFCIQNVHTISVYVLFLDFVIVFHLIMKNQESWELWLDGFWGNRHSKMPNISAKIFFLCFWAAIMDLLTQN